MQLLHSPASPFVRKVMLVLHETDQLGDVEIVSTATTPLASDATLVAANPVGKIPALIRTDGPALYDSRVICRYLDDRAQAGLYPQSQLWDILTLEATADGIMDAAVAITYEMRFRSEEIQFADWMDAQWAKIARSLGVVNTRWMSHLSGPLNMGQLAMGAALGYLDFRHDARDWRSGHDALAAWYADFATRPAMQATQPG